jgi:hypothetical protein
MNISIIFYNQQYANALKNKLCQHNSSWQVKLIPFEQELSVSGIPENSICLVDAQIPKQNYFEGIWKFRYNLLESKAVFFTMFEINELCKYHHNNTLVWDLLKNPSERNSAILKFPVNFENLILELEKKDKG